MIAMKYIKSMMISLRNIINNSGGKLDSFTRKLFFERLNMSRILIKYFLMDYVIKVSLFNSKPHMFGITRSAILIYNSLGLAIVFRAIYDNSYNESHLLVHYLFLIFFVILAFLSFVVVRNVPLKYINKHADFTQIIGLNQHILNGKGAKYLNDEQGAIFLSKVGNATRQWTSEIDNEKSFNSPLIIFHPIVILIIYLAVLIPLTYHA